MELARPGHHNLIRKGIATEVEAETLARHHPTGGRPVKIGVWLSAASSADNRQRELTTELIPRPARIFVLHYRIGRIQYIINMGNLNWLP